MIPNFPDRCHDKNQAPHQHPMIGTSLAHYRILERHGSGGMGVVYRAEDLNLRRIVALKLLPQALAEDPVARQRLLREARAASKLTHPNIATIYEAGEFRGQLYLAMEFVDGESLARLIQRGPLPHEELARIGAQMAEALEAAHLKGVIHRDVKPSNVLINSEGVVKVVDFGLAMQSHPTSVEEETEGSGPTEAIRLTRTGFTAGTVAYMSPEQARGETPTALSDIFSMGIVLYEMATGKLPFQSSSPFGVAAAIVHEEPTPLRELRPGIPGGLEEIIQKCLSKEPSARPASSARVRDALFMLLEGRPADRLRRALGTAGARRHPLPIGWIVAALVVAAAVGSLWLIRNSWDSPQPIRDLEARRLFRQGQHYESRGCTRFNLETAEQRYRKALDLEPESPYLLGHLARLLGSIELHYHAQERLEEIRELSDRALEEAPGLAAAWVARSRLHLLEGDPERAAEAARRAIDAEESNYGGYMLLGEAMIADGQTVRGLAELRRAVDVGEGHIWARSRLARILVELGRNDEAAVEFGRILEYDPNSPTALNNLGGIYLRTGRYYEAAPLFQRLLSLQPDETAASNLGIVYFYLDQLDDAVEAYRQAIELAPDRPTYKRNLAETYEKMGDPDLARDWYARALEDFNRILGQVGESQRAQNLARRAFLMAKLDRFQEAGNDIGEVVRQEPDNMKFLYIAAQVHALAGDREKAYGFLRRAMAAGYAAEEISSDPTFEAYRKNDPEFQRLLVESGTTP